MVALGVLAAFSFAVSVALAGTYQAACNLQTGYACKSTEKHTYDDAGAYAPNAYWAYVGANIVSDLGTVRAQCYGSGSCYAYYRENTGTFFYGYWANHTAQAGTVYIVGTFHY